MSDVSTFHRYIVYALIDPRSKLIRYVGKSSSGLHRAREFHWHGKVAGWMRELANLGLKPEIAILETVPDPNAPGTRCWWWRGMNATALNDAERYWIWFWRGFVPLLNVQDGGGGNAGECLCPVKTYPDWAICECGENYIQKKGSKACCARNALDWAMPVKKRNASGNLYIAGYVKRAIPCSQLEKEYRERSERVRLEKLAALNQPSKSVLKARARIAKKQKLSPAWILEPWNAARLSDLKES
jgi:hypothetical protein